MSPSEKWVWQFLYIQNACIIFYHVYHIEICHEFHSTKTPSYLWPIFCQTKFGQSMIFGCHKHESKEEENGFLFIFGVRIGEKGKVFVVHVIDKGAGVTLFIQEIRWVSSCRQHRNQCSIMQMLTLIKTLFREEGWSERWEEASKGSFQERDE